MHAIRPLAALVSLALISPLAMGQNASGVRALADLSLEDLMRVEVVSASRGSDRLGDVAAPVFVITRDDILRTGVRSLPEALRLAPGVDVARLSGARWAVGVRGDAGRFSNKLQVLIDGRSIYSPLFSGVMWETQRVPMTDIERIEIIRGPAGAVWGANAVNGVINIITRQAQDSLGRQVDVELGSEGAAVIHGSHSSGNAAQGAWRLYAQIDGTGQSSDPSGGEANDASIVRTAGLRHDREIDADTRISTQAQLLHSRSEDTRLRPVVVAPYLLQSPTTQTISRAHAHATLTRRLAPDAQLTVAGMLVIESGEERGSLSIDSQTADLELAHAFRPAASAHQITWGLGTRLYADHNQTQGLGQFTPARRRLLDWRLFAQDRWVGFDDRLSVVGGLRVDHTYFAGTRSQPSLAVAWKQTPDTTLWSSLSRAIRVPSRGEEDADLAVAVIPPGRAGNPLPILLRSGSGAPTLVESVEALQAGLRSRVDERLALDATVFRQVYDPLSFHYSVPVNPQVVMAQNPYIDASLDRVAGRAVVRGVELSADWRPLPSLRQQLGYTWLSTEVPETVSRNGNALSQSPKHLLTLRLSYDVSPHLSVDAWARYIGSRGQDPASPSYLPARKVLDLSARWSVARNVVLSARAYNLGGPRRVEIHPDIGYSKPVEVAPGVGLRVELSH
ncbi:TonB-dependent receptor [Sphaerotilus sp.]|uniref:TonB-dependent receptor plug domain-containing protein n=1 Tax=Sphaerotilus sp. TaxID=2093942 RepID=UPI002ACDB025|nr:TonB-dependent receptor [Sphaerotilus sp.]MDZ7856043.1 TonB-dependent receptor [Sphaerotilus sp.]